MIHDFRRVYRQVIICPPEALNILIHIQSTFIIQNLENSLLNILIHIQSTFIIQNLENSREDSYRQIRP